MPRSKEITINEKKVIVREHRVKDLEALIEKFKGDFEAVSTIKTAEGLKQVVGALLRTRLPDLIPGLHQDDIGNAYPSEIEEALGAFIEVNFTGLRKLIGQIFSLAHVASR